MDLYGDPPDTTTRSYWLRWWVFLSALVLLILAAISAALIWKHEGSKRRGSEREENQGEPPGKLYEDEAWKTCFKGIHPAWLLAYRIFSFLMLLALLIACVVLYGGEVFYSYSQWTFALVTIYFGYASLISAYGCFKYHKEGGGGEAGHMSTDAEQGAHRPPVRNGSVDTWETSNIHEEPSQRQTAGVWIYIFQVLFQICAGTAILTDTVFWIFIYPVSDGMNFTDIGVHLFNLVFLLGDTSLNSLRFPMFRIAYFILWSGLYVIFQWIFHAFVRDWWPYNLGLSSPFAPIWYLLLGLAHVPCFGAFAFVAKVKNHWFSKWFPESYRGLG